MKRNRGNCLLEPMESEEIEGQVSTGAYGE